MATKLTNRQGTKTRTKLNPGKIRLGKSLTTKAIPKIKNMAGQRVTRAGVGRGGR